MTESATTQAITLVIPQPNAQLTTRTADLTTDHAETIEQRIKALAKAGGALPRPQRQLLIAVIARENQSPVNLKVKIPVAEVDGLLDLVSEVEL